MAFAETTTTAERVRGRRRMLVSLDFIVSALMEPGEARRKFIVTENALPQDAKIVAWAFDGPPEDVGTERGANWISLVLESAAWEGTEGDVLPATKTIYYDGAGDERPRD